MTGGSSLNRKRQSPPFRVEIDTDNAIVAAFGELDMSTVDELDAALQQTLNGGSCHHLVLDLRGRVREARNELPANDATHSSAGEERAGMERPSSTRSGPARVPGSTGPGSEGGASS